MINHSRHWIFRSVSTFWDGRTAVQSNLWLVIPVPEIRSESVFLRNVCRLLRWYDKVWYIGNGRRFREGDGRTRWATAVKDPNGNPLWEDDKRTSIRSSRAAFSQCTCADLTMDAPIKFKIFMNSWRRQAYRQYSQPWHLFWHLFKSEEAEMITIPVASLLYLTWSIKGDGQFVQGIPWSWPLRTDYWNEEVPENCYLPTGSSCQGVRRIRIWQRYGHECS